MLDCGHFAVSCNSDTQQVPFLSFYLCCYANIINPHCKHGELKHSTMEMLRPVSQLFFPQIAALTLLSCWVKL